MTFDSASVLRHLQELQRHIAAASLNKSLATVRDRRDRQSPIRTKMDRLGDVIAMAATIVRIKAQVVPADGLGATFESLSELGLRAARWIVLTELDTLRAHVAWRRHGKARSPAPCWGPFSGIEDLTIYLRDELGQITKEWTTYRDMAGERGAYRAALREAHASMRALGHASDLARFLRMAQTLVRRPALRATCARMCAALTVRIDVDPDTPLLIAARPIHEQAAEGAQ
jgi:hypothetical protein